MVNFTTSFFFRIFRFFVFLFFEFFWMAAGGDFGFDQGSQFLITNPRNGKVLTCDGENVCGKSQEEAVLEKHPLCMWRVVMGSAVRRGVQLPKQQH